MIGVVAPEYSVEVDAFAKYVVLHIVAQDPDLQNEIIDKLVIHDQSDNPFKEEQITRDRTNNIITVKGLSDNNLYDSLKTVFIEFEKILPNFRTESASKLANGNFIAKVAPNLIFSNIQVGGKYHVLRDFTITTNIDREVPEDWATVNALTASKTSSNMNTWYVVPSTYLIGGEAIIESVGYNNAGPNIPTSSGSTTYYCTNSPSDNQLNKASGELFLGSYPQGGNRTNGKAFSSRPSSLTFEYKYTPLNQEQAQVDIQVFDASGNLLSGMTEYLSAVPDKTTKKVNLPAYPFGKKAAKIYVCFRSTKEGVIPAINIPTGSDLNEHLSNGLPTSGTSSVNDLAFHAVAKGSVLVIDNVALGYDDVVGVKDVPNNKSKR